MRTRSVVLAGLLGALVALGVPVLASAAPRHDQGLTINATPNPIDAGQGVLIYGQLQGAGDAGQTIYLYHRIALASRFTRIGHTTTNQFGFYEFTRQEGVVMTNRSWFVRGPSSTHSHTIHERVSALVSLHANPASTVTGHRVVFGGQVTPRHAFQRVLLQEQESANGDVWRTIGSTFTNRNAHFALSHVWRRPGDETVRALFPGDRRNVAGGSDSLTIVVMQREKPAFTLSTSEPVINEGQSATLSGTLEKAGTSTPDPGAQVTLYGRSPNGTVKQLGSTQTASDGSYSFTVTPTSNTQFWARTPKGRRSAPVNQGVRDVVTITSSSDASQDGGSVVLSGNVSPSKVGHGIFLQRLGDDGAWHDVAHTTVAAGSAYSFTYTFGQDGTTKLRARIYGGPWNVGGASPAETIAVSGVAPIS
ncbi:MAG TPA: hypothetical protein VG405_04290 [Solirubrobacteraceae bacterium]|jgi:hypothetical protein|nr:hypothetical protein [Solirubrobacteraceae bacterium]